MWCGMPRITLIVVNTRDLDGNTGCCSLNYKEWCKIYNSIYREFWQRDSFILPLRSNCYIAFSNGLSRKDLEEAVNKIEEQVTRSIKAVSVVHKYPAIAQLIASRIIRSLDRLYYEDNKPEDRVTIAYVSLESVLGSLEYASIYEEYIEATALYTDVVKLSFRLGGIAGFVGDSDLVAIIPEEHLDLFIENFPHNAKIGIGISLSSKKALLLAIKALGRIEKSEVSTSYAILRDDS